MGMDDSPQLEDLLKEYVAISNKREQEKLEKERAEAERLRQEKDGKMHAYEEAKAELVAELEATVNGSYSQSLIRILKDQPDKKLHVGTFTREHHGATTQTYDHKYGICSGMSDDAGPVIFYLDKLNCSINTMSTSELLEFATVRGRDDLPKLVLTARQYKEDLTGAVKVALNKLRTGLIQEKPQV